MPWSVCLSRSKHDTPLSSNWTESGVCEKTRSRERERAKLWRSPVHLITGTTVTSPTVSESPVWQPHFLHSLSHTRAHTHTFTELCFTLVGAVCYPPGSVPSACLPAHHINPIMLHCLGCSGPGRPPSGKRGGGHEEEEREGESEEKRRSHTDTVAGMLKSESGFQGSGAVKASYCETSDATAATKAWFTWVRVLSPQQQPVELIFFFSTYLTTHMQKQMFGKKTTRLNRYRKSPN